MGSLRVPSGNEVLDLGTIALMSTAINNLEDTLAKENSKIYTGKATPPATITTAELGIVTAYTEIATDTSTATKDRRQKTIEFGKTFAYPPVVTATPILETSGISVGNIPDVSIIINTVSTTAVILTVVFNSNLGKTNVGVNVIAIGTL